MPQARQLRGTPLLTDYRHRLLFVYAIAATWFTTNEEQLRAELEGFVADHFENPKQYTAASVGSVIARTRHDRNGIARVWNGRRAPNRYRLTNRCIIKLLEISGDEQREMKSIIGGDELRRRRELRRRQRGMVKRSAYLANAATKRARALELCADGLTHSAIADELGIHRGSVPALLRPRS